jgi:hypothetical protein
VTVASAIRQDEYGWMVDLADEASRGRGGQEDGMLRSEMYGLSPWKVLR